MPLNVRRFYTSVILILACLAAAAISQTVQPPPSSGTSTTDLQNVQPVAKTPTAGEIMRERISKAKAFIAVRNYNAAIYELDNIRRETADASVQSVVNVLLMNSYLEQSDYKRSQDFLNDFFNQQKTTKPNATANYLAIASQVVKGARSRAERYRALGLNVSDRTLPLEAVNDLEKMRETLELVITQSKELGKDRAKTQDAMALLEEAANSRGMLARDEYDARHWRDELADTREQMTSSRSVVLNAVNDGAPDNSLAQNNLTVAAMPATVQPNAGSLPGDPKITFQPVITDTNRNTKPSDTAGQLVQKTVMQAATDQQSQKSDDKGVAAKVKPDTTKPLVVGNAKPNIAAGNQKKVSQPSPSVDSAKSTDPLDVGSLLAYATKQAQAVYPMAAKNMHSSGIVRVEVTVDENGNVAEVQKTSGPALLQGAAKDAIKKWRFKPFVREGQPVKATGFVNFNFSL